MSGGCLLILMLAKVCFAQELGPYDELTYERISELRCYDMLIALRRGVPLRVIENRVEKVGSETYFGEGCHVAEFRETGASEGLVLQLAANRFYDFDDFSRVRETSRETAPSYNKRLLLLFSALAAVMAVALVVWKFGANRNDSMRVDHAR